MKIRSLFACLVCVSTFIGTSSADNYDYYGKANLKLGAGFRKLNPSQAPPPCLVVSPQTKTEDATIGNFILETKLVNDRSQLYSLLHIDAHLAGRTLAASANVDASFDKETSLESADLTWIMYAFQEFGSETIDPVFNQPAALLKNTPERLIQRCGQEYVQSVTKASQIAAVFTLHSLNLATKTTLQSHFAAGATWTGSDLNFSANYKSFLREASQHGSVEVRIFGFGGGGVQKLSDIVLRGDDFENVRNTLATYIRTEMVASKAFPISFNTSAFGDLTEPPVSYAPIGNPPELDSIYLEYVGVLSRIGRIEEMLGGRNGRFGYITDDQVEYLNSVRKSMTTHLSQLSRQAIQCNKIKGNCSFPDIDSQIVNWPISPEENCFRWRNGLCVACEVPISFVSQLTGTAFSYACSHMPEGSIATVKFDGLFVTVNVSEEDNKVWNTAIVASAKGLEPCLRCTLARVSPGLGAGGPPNSVQLDPYWKIFDFEGQAKVVSGKAQVQLVIDKCQAGDHLTVCDSAPPGLGSDKSGPNRGFPVAYPPPQAKVRFEVQ